MFSQQHQKFTFKMSFNWLLIIALIQSINSSPAPLLPPIMTSHTEMIDMGHLKMLPAGTYPDYAAAALAIATDENLSENNDKNLMKRSWQSLQGAWGKRSINNNDDEDTTINNFPENYHTNMENFNAANNLLSNIKEDPNEITTNTDENEENTNTDYQNLLKYSEIYRLSPVTDSLLLQEPLMAEFNEEKRAWKNRNMGWGKRRANDWNKFRGAWGKREPSWNNLKGLWGKRSGNWNKLQSAWGKRNNLDGNTRSTGINSN